jgi:hypothetical protein
MTTMRTHTLITLACAGTLAAAAPWALAEDLTVTSYYPSPRGVYEVVQTRGNTALAITGPARVGIRMAAGAPLLQKVHVNGDVRADLYIGFGEVPPGTIMIFTGACPADWTRLGGLPDGRFLRGSAAYGATGGSTTHAHTNTHNHPLTPIPVTPTGWAGNHFHTVDIEHNHWFDYAPPMPATGGGSWTKNDNTNNGVNPQFFPEHEHANFSGTTSLVSGGGSRSSTNPADHSHDVGPIPLSSTPASPGAGGVSNEPPFINVVLCQRNP